MTENKVESLLQSTKYVEVFLLRRHMPFFLKASATRPIPAARFENQQLSFRQRSEHLHCGGNKLQTATSKPSASNKIPPTLRTSSTPVEVQYSMPPRRKKMALHQKCVPHSLRNPFKFMAFDFPRARLSNENRRAVHDRPGDGALHPRGRSWRHSDDSDLPPIGRALVHLFRPGEEGRSSSGPSTRAVWFAFFISWRS